MAVIKPLYGSARQSITITLNGLAASATVGRASTSVDNTSSLFDDVLVTVTINAGAVSGNKQALVYAYASLGDSTFTEGVTGTDASFTRQDPTNLIFLGTVPLPTSASVESRTFSLATAFGTLPQKWGVVVFNDSGVAFAGSGCTAQFQGVQDQVV